MLVLESRSDTAVQLERTADEHFPLALVRYESGNTRHSASLSQKACRLACERLSEFLQGEREPGRVLLLANTTSVTGGITCDLSLVLLEDEIYELTSHYFGPTWDESFSACFSQDTAEELVGELRSAA